MTSEEKDRFICEKLGVCWHEPKSLLVPNFEPLECTCGAKIYTHSFTEHQRRKNPDFASEAGRVQLLKLMRKREDWEDFVVQMDIRGEWIFNVMADYIINDTGKLRDAVWAWMGGKEQ